MIAQLLGARLRVPAIVLLLLFGVALGPSGLALVHPDALAGGLTVIVKLVVAIVLFDGALNLRAADLRQAAAEVRQLITVGVPVTLLGATLAAHFLARVSWTVALVFGALVTVTGPTVVQPLLKRVELPRRVKATLEGEAILADPVGALLAVALVDVVLGIAGVRPIGVLGAAWAYFGRLLIGIIVGVVGGWVVSRMLRSPRIVPADFANLVALTGVWAAFAAAESLQSEAGIMAVVAMGLTLQRGAVPEERRLRRFKEQLTLLGVGILFILLAASLPLSALRSEGVTGVLAVAALMFIVRPASVALALRRSTLTWRERAFVAWLGPRGIVAASVASIFAIALQSAGFPEGPRLLALTFLTVAMTVTIQGLTAGPVAWALGLQSMAGRRAVVVGAGPLARVVATTLRDHGRPVVLVDRNTALVQELRAAGFEAIEGNALDEVTLEQARTEEADTFVAVTTNSEVNALAAHLAHEAFGVARALPALGHPSHGASAQLLARVGGRLAFGRPIDVRLWDRLLEDERAQVVTLVLTAGGTGSRVPSSAAALDEIEEVIPIALVHGDVAEITTREQSWRQGDQLIVVSRVGVEETERLVLGGTREDARVRE